MQQEENVSVPCALRLQGSSIQKVWSVAAIGNNNKFEHNPVRSWCSATSYLDPRHGVVQPTNWQRQVSSLQATAQVAQQPPQRISTTW
jgi:hypothetical protein